MSRATRIVAAGAVLLAGLLPAAAYGDLIAHWWLDEAAGTTAADAVGTHSGTLHGGPAWRPDGGKVRGALEFDGVDDYVRTPFVLNPSAGPFAVFAWVKAGRGGNTIVSQADGSGAGQMWLSTMSSGKLMTGLWDGARPTPWLVSNSVVADGNWHHVGLVWDGARRHLFADGLEIATDKNAMGRLWWSDGGLLLGAGKTVDKSTLWVGLIDDVRVYSDAPSSSEVAQIYVRSQVAPETVTAMALLPKTLYTGARSALTVTTLSAASHQPAAVPVVVQFKAGSADPIVVFQGSTDASGRATVQFDTPDVAPGAYPLEILVQGASKPVAATVQVQQMPILLIETDKPIYKPSQTIQGRVLVLTNVLKPTASAVSVEITDGKGVKIFRKELATNTFGVAPFQLPLASELNYGTWKITAKSGSASGSVDVRVEQYVLPRFEVDVQMQRDYFLVNEKVPGTVSAVYFFGKNVDGSVEIRASRYVGVWEQYAQYTAPLAQGKAEFTLPEVRYVSGTPGAGGSGSVQLDIVVTDTSGHQEKATKLLTMVDSTIQHQIIPLSKYVVPGQPFTILLTAETPDGRPATVSAETTCDFYDRNYRRLSQAVKTTPALDGSTSISFTAPTQTAWILLQSKATQGSQTDSAAVTMYALYSPSDSFLCLQSASGTAVTVGDTVVIDAIRTHQSTVYYDVYANGHTVWSDAVAGSRIQFQATAQMVPAARVVAYIINPNNEVSADVLSLDVNLPSSAGDLDVNFDTAQALPGDPVQVSIRANAQAMVGLAIVDESVYALNAGRLNMQQVFGELERRFMAPQAEAHEWPTLYGALEVFGEAGLQAVGSDMLRVPKGEGAADWLVVVRGKGGGIVPGLLPGADGSAAGEKNTALAEVTRVRQYFPETWLWTPDLLTQPDGTAQIDLTAPDSITTWRLHAVSTSAAGLGMTESSLRVFQEFFGEPDLPYAVTRGERFPIRIQVFNYLDQPQVVRVELASADWFDLIDPNVRQVTVGADAVGSASFLIQPKKLGRNILDVTLRSPLRADAVRKELLVEPEGTPRELVTNGLIRAGEKVVVDANIPVYRVAGSQKRLLSITPSLVAQSINGVDDLLQMPYGCGEQNMIFFAPDVEILRYLNATGQLTPEVRAKAEYFITVGYQRELTFQHADGSFSAFGQQDETGSLWLTAFVLNCFSGAKDIYPIDGNVLAWAVAWITAHQKPNGSWDPIGFVCHSEMVGGLKGTYTLTAFVTIALCEYGGANSSTLASATDYLARGLIGVWDDPYALAVASLALARAGHSDAQRALNRLLELAVSDADGIHWTSHAVETTAYAALAMIHLERPQANEAIKWLSLQRNGQGGFGSTQDTVMALKALMPAASAHRRNVNLTITAKSADGKVVGQFTVNPANFDVLQIAELPESRSFELSAEGSGEVRFQLVRRFNVLLRDQCIQTDMALDVTYDANHVDVDDIVNVTATVRYFGREQTTGMVIVDVGVPTGFAAVQESLDALVNTKKVSRIEQAGRKVIFYLEGLPAGEQRVIQFQVKARFPVRAIAPDSKAYLYYDPGVRAETAGREITVGAVDCNVDFSYLLNFAVRWLSANGGSASDLDANGSVDFLDFRTLADIWLGTCP